MNSITTPPRPLSLAVRRAHVGAGISRFRSVVTACLACAVCAMSTLGAIDDDRPRPAPQPTATATGNGNGNGNGNGIANGGVDDQADGQAVEDAGAPVAPAANGRAGDPVIVHGDPDLSPPTRSRVLAARRPTEEGPVILGFKQAPLEELVRFIVESTGKVVMIRLVQVGQTRITLLNDRPIPRHEALDLLFKAMRLNGVGVVETEREIIIDLLTDIQKLQDPGITLGADETVSDLAEDGAIISKIFRIRIAKAERVAENIRDFLPDFATITVDPNSNQIIYQGTVGVAKRVQLLIDALDKPMHVVTETETFRLKYADATVVADNIRELFEASRTQGGGAAAQRGRPADPRQAAAAAARGAVGASDPAGTSEQLRIVVFTQTNSITISAEPDILRDIRSLITGAWDIPLDDAGNFRYYNLVYADPIVVRDVLQTLLEGGSSARGRGAGPAGAAGRPGGAAGGGDGGAESAVANIFRIEALPDTGQLLAISRTPDNFPWLDRVIEVIDQPSDIGMPVFVELRHANAISVAEQLNALFQESGGGQGITGAQQGLTRGDVGSASVVGGATANAGQAGAAAMPEITFPWQRGRAGDAGQRSEVSPIVGRVRIMPAIQQNAISILAPPELQRAVLNIVEAMDKPGRQVLIAAIIASVELRDEFAYGLRVSRDGIVTPTTDNQIGGTIRSENQQNDFLNFFSSSVLNVNVDAVAVLQALDQKTNVRILQQPKIFTSDNTEAVFFNGQEVPFISNSQTTDIGGLTQSFNYIPVGVTLNVRPQITAQRDVTLEINLTLSNIVPGQTLFGGAILDRRTTETRVTVRNGQTVVLSGIRVEQQTDVRRKVPILGEIPLLGDLLFTSFDKGTVGAELIAFVTPIVVDNPAENDLNYNEDALRRLDEIRTPWGKKPPRARDFGAGAFDPIQNPGQLPPEPGRSGGLPGRILNPGDLKPEDIEKIERDSDVEPNRDDLPPGSDILSRGERSTGR